MFKGDIFEYYFSHPNTNNAIVVIPTNKITKTNKSGKKELVMGGGLAKVVKDWYIWHDTSKVCEYLANVTDCKTLVAVHPNGGLVNLVCVPTKDHFQEKSKYSLILQALEYLHNNCAKYHVYCPKIGCGLGGLDWDVVYKLFRDKYETDLENKVTFVDLTFPENIKGYKDLYELAIKEGLVTW